MCFGSKDKGDATGPTEAGPPVRQTVIRDPNLFRTPTFEQSKALREGGRRESRASGHSPSESIQHEEKRTSTVIPEEPEVTPVPTDVGGATAPPEIQRVEEPDRRGADDVVR